MCKYCEKRLDEEKIAHDPIWLTEYVEEHYEYVTCVEVYLNVDTNKLNGKVKINYCPFCGRELK